MEEQIKRFLKQKCAAEFGERAVTMAEVSCELGLFALTLRYRAKAAVQDRLNFKVQKFAEKQRRLVRNFQRIVDARGVYRNASNTVVKA